MADSPTPSPTPGSLSPTPPTVPPQTGLAVVALVLGIFGVLGCGPLGLIAIITGIAALGQIRKHPERYGGKGLAIAGLTCGCASILTTALLVNICVTSVNRARELSRRLDCAYNMKAIGEAIKRYASGTNSEGEFDLDGLVRAGCLTREQTVCGSSGLGISNYIVARPSGLERPADETIVLYEPLSNHGNEGGNFLYGDGHVMFNRRPLYDELVGEVARADR